MNKIKDKLRRARRRKFRIRKKISGSEERPRMTIFKSNRYTYLQVIDDNKMNTLVAVSNKEKDLLNVKNNNKNLAKLGEIAAERLKQKNITSIVFDRNGYKYHGIIKTIADAVRKAGIQF